MRQQEGGVMRQILFQLQLLRDPSIPRSFVTETTSYNPMPISLTDIRNLAGKAQRNAPHKPEQDGEHTAAA